MACDEALVRINTISPCWPVARTTVSQILTDVVKGLCSSKCVRTVAASTARQNFANLGWGASAWRPDETDCPILYCIEGNNIWWAYNTSGNDLGTVPATGGTGTAWKTMDADYTSFTPAVPANWSPAPSTVADALDQIVSTNPVGGFIRAFSYSSTFSGGQALSASANITLALATTSENTIAGSSVTLATERIRLPVGTYRLSYDVKVIPLTLGDGTNSGPLRVKLRNVTSSVDIADTERSSWGAVNGTIGIELSEQLFSVSNATHDHELWLVTPSTCTGKVNSVEIVIRQVS